MNLDESRVQAQASTLGGEGYTVLLADVIGSRRRGRRDELQERLLQTVDAINEDHVRHLASAADLTSGDEIQALLRRPSAAYDIAVTLQDRIRPVPLRVGIGFGALSAGQAGDPVRHLDGPAFHHARDALEASRRGALAVRLRGFGPLEDQASAALSLCWQIRQGWTETQRRTIQAYETHHVMRQAAHALGVSKSAVSQSLSAAKHRSIRAVERHTLEVLDMLWRAPDE